ncbi:hypothetical protein PVL29_012715 [Vitis rotundifolia]|uniref:Phosphate transporter n=1 Tax=Vitis rotundifolia TaxID=103349 RepID=A0AA38ZJG0_VITRO|nr:hypothetical protein PVL29_012715 [Vitis rotundifolia]
MHDPLCTLSSSPPSPTRLSSVTKWQLISNAMGTSVGSGALMLLHELSTAAVLEFSGALLMGTHAASTMQKDILIANVFQDKDTLLFAGLLSSLVAAGTWLQVAPFYGWPVSTTHCIVGSMVGFSLVYGGYSVVFWSSLAMVTSSWMISPLMEAMVAEIKSAIHALDVETVIFDDEFSAGQLRNLEKAFGGDVRVFDRATLILDIFH